MVFFLLAISLACGLWVYSRPKRDFLSDFAMLLEQPEVVQGLGNTLARRAFLKGEFRGRKVVVLLQNGGDDEDPYSGNLVISLETHAPVTMESYAFTDYKCDREGELALFALEVRHEFVLRHEEGCLKARWQPQKVSSNFDLQKCHSVLEAMHTLATSLER